MQQRKKGLSDVRFVYIERTRLALSMERIFLDMFCMQRCQSYAAPTLWPAGKGLCAGPCTGVISLKAHPHALFWASR
jgi:hypothetical protein